MVRSIGLCCSGGSITVDEKTALVVEVEQAQSRSPVYRELGFDFRVKSDQKMYNRKLPTGITAGRVWPERRETQCVNITLCAVPWPLSPGASVGEKRAETILLLLPPYTDDLINVVSQSVPAFYARNITVLMNDAICARAQNELFCRESRGEAASGWGKPEHALCYSFET